MNITGLAINSSQADLMNQISTKVLDMALDTVTETGEQTVCCHAVRDSTAAGSIRNNECRPY